VSKEDTNWLCFWSALEASVYRILPKVHSHRSGMLVDTEMKMSANSILRAQMARWASRDADGMNPV
jgi:hypothetical protein